MKVGLLLIDCQYDFCDQNGALFVPGADKDMFRLSKWIRANYNKINEIVMTIDSHQPNDISHPNFWVDKEGKNPSPFTQITLADVEGGRWIPKFEPETVRRYIAELEKQGEYPHIIWPEHCLSGSRGASVVDCVMDAVREWSVKNNAVYKTIVKGEYQFSEHFGAFRAQVPVSWRDDTQENTQLIEFFKNNDIIYVAGEAKSHCVANTIKQAIEIVPNYVGKIVILEDCMSDVEGMGYLGEPTYNKAREMGVKFKKTVKAETV